jgi:xylose isomerase
MIQDRYKSFDSGIGLLIESGTSTLEDCEIFIHENQEPKLESSKEEEY